MKRKIKAKQRISRKARVGRQCAAIPVQQDADGALVVMLVTSRDTGRWVVPKGWTAAKLTPAQAAAREAYEEAGVVGWIVSDTPLGRYHYQKRLTPALTIPCDVDVYLLLVEQQLETWPEQKQRETCWFTPSEAASYVDEPGLADILRSLPSMVEWEIGLAEPTH
jgi:8-oxo-dGTP pyrophosphatase MutT (NUDIX family)